MRRFLHPSRHLRPGCGPSIPRLFVPSHHTLSRIQIRPSSTRTSISPKEYRLIKLYHDPPPVFLKQLRRGGIDDWISALLEHVPESKPSTGSEPAKSLLDHKPQLDRIFRLTEYLSLARSYCEHDLLGHLGFELKQWPTVYTLLSSLADSLELLMPYATPQKSPVGFQWDMNGLSLDHISFPKNKLDQPPAPIPVSDFKSLDDLTTQPAARVLTNRLGGEILVNLGMLVLGAADRPAAEAQAAMSCVHRMLARLHHLGLISDRVYQFKPDDPSQLAIRPPGLHLLSPTIMSILSDAAWLEHEAALTSAAKEAGEEPPYLPFRVGCRELGPEIWIELILWCCVEHGLIKQGTSLLEAMTKRPDELAWKFESWTPLLEDFETVQQTNISGEQFWRRPGTSAPRPFKGLNKPPFNGLGHRTVSLEIVANLRNGLANRAYNGMGFHGMSPAQLIDSARPLTALLEPGQSAGDIRPTHRTSNWYIFRVLESCSLVPSNDPSSFEELIRSTRNLVPPWEEDWKITSKQLDTVTRAQFYDETAAMAGLVEHSARAYSVQRNSLRAFHQCAWLQNIVDASKYNHIQAFFEHLSRSGPEDVPFFDSAHYDKSPVHKSSLPLVSSVTLARLLDLAASSRTFEFGNWLLFNVDIDGPSIPAESYGDQALAPSILRFAIASQNQELGQKVIDSLHTPLSTNVLKAMANYQISMHKWDHVVMALEYIRNYRARSWGHSNLAALGAEIIRLSSSIERKVADGIEGDGDERQHLDSARDLFFRFFDEEFNTPSTKNRRVDEFQQRILQRMLDVFLTVPGELSRLAGEVTLKHPIQNPSKLEYIPTASFQVLLSAVVDTHGSGAGKELWSKWVFQEPLLAGYSPKDGGVERLRARSERNLAAGDPNFNKQWLASSQKAAVLPHLDLIRTIAHAAVREFYGEPLPAEPLSTDQPSSYTSSSLPEESISEPTPTAPRVAPIPFSKAKSTYTVKIPKSLFKFQTAGGGKPPVSRSEAILDFCVTMMIRAGLREHQIFLEIPRHFERMRARGVFTRRDKEARMRAKEMRNDPWVIAYVQNLVRK